MYNIGNRPQEECICTYDGEAEPSINDHACIRMMVTDSVRQRQEYGGYFPEGAYQLSMRLQ